MIRILFDITPILNGEVDNGMRTGIYFCAYNILKELEKRTDILLDFYCSPELAYMAEKCVGTGIVNKKALRISQYRFMAEQKKKACPKSRKVLYYTYAALEIFIENLAKQIGNCGAFEENAYDVFLSAAGQAPKKIYNSKKILKVIVLHDVISIMFPEYFHSPFWRGKGWSQHLFKTVNNSEVFLANSHCTKRDFLRYRPDIDDSRIYVLHHAASPYFQPCNDVMQLAVVKEKYHIPGDKKYIFSLCAIEPRKNLIRIVKTFMQFIEKNHIDDLVIALGGKAWNSFKAQFEEGVGDSMNSKCVIRMGYVEDADLPVLYSGAEWFVYTSQYEGFGVPPLEAMCCGCPVIASDSSSIPEVVGDAGLLIPWDSDEAHVEAYEKYYFDEKLRKDFAHKALERSKQFSWETYVENMMMLMKKNQDS